MRRASLPPCAARSGVSSGIFFPSLRAGGSNTVGVRVPPSAPSLATLVLVLQGVSGARPSALRALGLRARVPPSAPHLRNTRFTDVFCASACLCRPIAHELNTFRVNDHYDVVFSTGVLHSCDPVRREEITRNYQAHTADGGLHVLSVFVDKPFIAPAPDGDPNGYPWKSGELLGLYADWLIEWSVEEIFDCMSSGVPHKHAVNRVAARKPTEGLLTSTSHSPRLHFAG